MSPIYKRRIFQSDQKLETHSLVSSELAEHRLRWHGDVVDTQFYKFHTPRLSLYSLSYGAEVSIYPEDYRDFSLVHFSLKRGIAVEADGMRWDVRQGQTLISSPSSSANLRWCEASEQIILRMPDAFLLEAADELKQRHLFQRIKKSSGLLMSDRASQQWQAQLLAFIALEDYARESEDYRPWLRHMEISIAMFLLLQGHTAARPPPEEEVGAAAGVGRAKSRLERLLAYVDANLTEPITLADLARAAAMSERQLNTACHEHLGMSPIAWLRGQRLDAVRRILSVKPHVDIAATAMLYGFFNLGRFSSYYRSRFGELPSQTVKIARSG
ncbi:AraC family transcriptional regulator [Ensifer sp. ENS05]|uniref:AraC family transcriptional regulator n=1 Tax=Ensifer sp. ENS05 TaxID=2769277 RepID=UPI001FEE6E9D|nr:AraC family transcriptional regulator [Ensifer sp. ENS05]